MIIFVYFLISEPYLQDAAVKINKIVMDISRTDVVLYSSCFSGNPSQFFSAGKH